MSSLILSDHFHTNVELSLSSTAYLAVTGPRATLFDLSIRCHEIFFLIWHASVTFTCQVTVCFFRSYVDVYRYSIFHSKVL